MTFGDDRQRPPLWHGRFQLYAQAALACLFGIVFGMLLAGTGDPSAETRLDQEEALSTILRSGL